MRAVDEWYVRRRLGGLRRFAVAITILNLLGHTVLGFEQSWAQPLVALATAYSVECLLELLDAWGQQRRPRCLGSLGHVVDFLLSAHITGLAVAMLLYANDRLWPIAFAVTVALGSKLVLRAPLGTGTRHVFNPSNFGITVTLLLFSWVGIAQPYHFTENLYGMWDWALPGLIIITGSLVNALSTKRWPLIAAWLTGFVVQACARSLAFGTPLGAALLPMTGVAFILYTFYMVTDPATTPETPGAQVAFGAGVALTYGVLLLCHVVFGLFFALSIVCAVRGLGLYALALWTGRHRDQSSVQAPVAAGRMAL